MYIFPQNDDNYYMAIGRTDSMQELIFLLDEIFGETIIGSDINLIKHLFYYLKFENREFIFEYEDRFMAVVVEGVKSEFVDLRVLGFEDQGTRRAKLKFEVINVLYVFEVIIHETFDDLVTIKIPTELQSAEMRKHRRVICDDLFMNFIILYKSFKGGRYVTGDDVNAERKYTHLFREIKEDNPSLKLMNLMIVDYILSVTPEFDFVIYRQGDGNDFIRKVLSIDNKSIFIGDCTDIDSYIKKIEHSNLKSFNEVYQRMSYDKDEFEAIEFFQEYQKKEIRNFMVSYIITPITIFDKVIGHLRVYTTAMDRHNLTIYQAEFIHEMMELSSYGFTKLAIKGSSYNTAYTNIKIIDLSISGLLFEINDDGLYRYLRKHNLVKMSIPIREETLNIKGEIMRYYTTKDSYKMGVTFLDSNPDDMKILENYIFEKKANILSEL